MNVDWSKAPEWAMYRTEEEHAATASTMIAPTLNPIQPPAEAEAKRRAAREAARKALDVWASVEKARRMGSPTPTMAAIFGDTKTETKIYTRLVKGKREWHIGSGYVGKGWELHSVVETSNRTFTYRVDSAAMLIAASVSVALADIPQAKALAFGDRRFRRPISLYPRPTSSWSEYEEEAVPLPTPWIDRLESRVISRLMRMGVGVSVG